MYYLFLFFHDLKYLVIEIEPLAANKGDIPLELEETYQSHALKCDSLYINWHKNTLSGYELKKKNAVQEPVHFPFTFIIQYIHYHVKSGIQSGLEADGCRVL